MERETKVNRRGIFPEGHKTRSGGRFVRPAPSTAASTIATYQLRSLPGRGVRGYVVMGGDGEGFVMGAQRGDQRHWGHPAADKQLLLLLD